MRLRGMVVCHVICESTPPARRGVWFRMSANSPASATSGMELAIYNLIGAGDFNHDGTPDLLWFNPTNGDVDIWKIVNGQWAGSVAVGAHPPGARPLGDGDYNGDGTGDVLWYNASSNAAEVWMMQNGQWAGSVDVGTHPAGWQPFAGADMDNDGDHRSALVQSDYTQHRCVEDFQRPVGREFRHGNTSGRLRAGRGRRLQQRRLARHPLVQPSDR